MTAQHALADDRRPFSVPQLAMRWGCSEGLIRKLIRESQLQCFRPGALIRIAAAAAVTAGSVVNHDAFTAHCWSVAQTQLLERFPA